MSDFIQDATVLKSTSKACKGDSYVYNIQVETAADGKEWFGCGFEDPNVNEGDIIEFEIEQVGDYTNVILDTLVVVEAAPERQRSSRGSSRGDSRSSGRGNSRSSGRGSDSRSSNSRGGSRDKPSRGRSEPKSRGRAAPKEDKPTVDWARKDNLIRLQSCQNTAIATIRGALEASAIALPAKKGEKFDAYQALIEDEAARLYSKYEDIVDGVYDAGGNDEQEEYGDDVPD